MKNRRIARALIAVIFAGVSTLTAVHAQESSQDAQAIQRDIDSNPTLRAAAPSQYDSRAATGQPFFLLSDASYGSNEIAQVRLEAQGRHYDERLRGYGGADIVVYRVPDPLAFLKAQKNLHRLNVAPNYRGEGLANTLSWLWDRWVTDARRAWQRVLSFVTRRKVVDAHPEFSLGTQPQKPAQFEPSSRFAPLRGYEVIARFRYPIWEAKNIEPPAGTHLSGSSSNFIDATPGNVMIPVGRQQPGLYLVEAIIGDYRAHTLLFVSDTVAVAKSASGSLLVWAARRDSGKPVTAAQVMWTDGVGVLQSGATGADGALALSHVSPERSYVIGRDPEGGVFVSENFYYDSEIYNTKIYAVTDRPMYRAGDTVHVKFLGRTFRSANESVAAAPADLKLEVLDPNGAPIATRTVRFRSDSGGDADFALPSAAPGGGYTIRFDYRGDSYGSAFRVAEYVKPHFDVNLVMDKRDYATGEPPKGRIELRYPNGKPVRNGRVSVTLRAQRVAIADGELHYAGLFPVELDQQELETNNDGVAALTLPAAVDPSRYVLTLLAQDGAAYRVRVTRELLIARGATPYRLSAPKTFSQPGERVDFTLQSGGPLDATSHQPTRWEWVRLESQTREQGAVGNNGKGSQGLAFPISFAQAGSYMVSVKDEAGNLLAATSHWVAGDGLKALPGSIEIVFDRERYRIGDTAEALITFAQPTDDALLTLERDRVERRALLSRGADWLSLQQVAPTQWKARIKVEPDFAPNMTFSALYVKDGQYVFQNAGIVVTKPSIDLDVKSDKPVYGPGETVTLDITSALAGKPLATRLTVSVVDEMVYVLQPEIAPGIVDFFYHPRRNNVRTTSSLSFITYDLALAAERGTPAGTQANRYNQRGVKVLERPRRDDVDTAAWQPDLRTDASGRAKMTFRMPDSLARWRVTVRAVADDGSVGQRTAYVRSDKALYLKWSGPTHFRSADQPAIDMLAFNQGTANVDAQWTVNGGGFAISRNVTLKPGANYLSLPGGALATGVVDASVSVNGRSVDRLQTPIGLEASTWLEQRELSVALNGSSNVLTLPVDAQDVRVRLLGSSASQFARVADDLISYPYGCAEQTSSRLIPLALSYDALTRVSDTRVPRELEDRLRSQRQRLAMLAGVNGVFGWWGDWTGGSALITAYAYYADWLASRTLGISLPESNWQRALDVYRDVGAKEPLLHRAVALWLLQQIGLPVATPVSGVARELANERTAQKQAARRATARMSDSVVFVHPDSPQGIQMAILLTAYTAKLTNAALPPNFASLAESARASLANDSTPVTDALLAMTGARTAATDPAAVLSRVSASYPTMDRALTLVWLRRSLGGETATALPALQGTGWTRTTTSTGVATWTWTGSALPASLDVGAASADVTALVSYRSREVQPGRLPVAIERRLYRLDAKKSAEDDASGRVSFVARLVKSGDAIDANSLYVDEVSLAPQNGAVTRYGLLDIPLPPGGSVEATSWGLNVDGLPVPTEGGSGPQPFARAATWEMGELSYHQPVPLLDRPVTLRQLVRFALPGTFAMPPARFFRMYQPDDKAYEGGRSDRSVMLRIQ